MAEQYAREFDFEADVASLFTLAGWVVSHLTVRRWGSGRGGFTTPTKGVPDLYAVGR